MRRLWHGVAFTMHRIISGGTSGMSETSRCRERLAPYCTGYGLDLGFGGDPITPYAVRVDLPVPYARYSDIPVQLGGTAADLYWFKDGVLDFVFSSHLLEDFEDTESVLREWLRVLKPGGCLVLFCPDEQVYRTHCRATGQPQNFSHKIPDFSLAYVMQLLAQLGVTEILHSCSLIDDYSWELVAVKPETVHEP